MTCSNVMLTLGAILIFLFVVWPGVGGMATKWVVGIACLAIVLIAWTGVKCSYCEKCVTTATPEMKPKKKK